MKDKDTQLIWEQYTPIEESSKLSSDKQNVLNKINQLDRLLPDDAKVQWNIQNGDFSGVNPHSAVLEFEMQGQPQPGEVGYAGVTPRDEHYTLGMLEKFLRACWGDERVAAKHNLAGADWSGSHTYNGEVFWTANDTHFQNIIDHPSSDVFTPSGHVQPEFEDDYQEFWRNKQLTDRYVKKLMNSNPMEQGLPDVTKDNFRLQKYWRVSISASSPDITKRGEQTYDAVGYGKGRYMGD